MRKNYKLEKRKILITLIVFILLLGANLSFGQKHFYMKEKEMYEKFKMATKNFEKGKEYFLKGNYKKSEKELRKCVEIMPEHVYAHFYLSQILYKKGDIHKALEHIEKAKANFKLMADLHAYSYQQYTSQLREQKDNLDMELFQLKEKLSTLGSESDERFEIEAAIGTTEHRIGIIKSRLTEPWQSEESMPADYFYFHGNIFFKLKKYQEAYAQYLEATKINPQHGNAYNNLANLYFMTKQYQKALDCLNKAEANGAKINPELKKAILKALGK